MEYLSLIIIVKKKDGKPQFCDDYRKLNAATIDEAAPLPVISETLRDLDQARMLFGYWQLPMADESKRYTAFSSQDKTLYQFRVMAFSLKNAPATFQFDSSRVDKARSKICDFGMAPWCEYQKMLQEYNEAFTQLLEKIDHIETQMKLMITGSRQDVQCVPKQASILKSDEDVSMKIENDDTEDFRGIAHIQEVE
ncbi:Retrovirus-related Pol polyprotein from transposon 17.6-like Protein [Tribolium castaneum]|nr:Retrovirus-related Pol polyprotein from transposon 17.6-like Protein [Tribolium castaneum]